MIHGKNVLAIIPARGGSKGLPCKNIRDLCGKPLLAWSVEAGLDCKYIDHVMVTTDSEEIAQVARKFGAEVPFLRPAELATDTATSIDVVKHVVNYYDQVLQKKFSLVVLLEPTSPLRAPGDLDAMIEKLILLEAQFDAIVSLGEVHEHPSIMKRIAGDGIRSYCQDLFMASRRQDNEPAYFPYCVAYITKTETLFEEESFYPRRTTHYLIRRYQCYEIDDIYDFLAVEGIMKHEWGIE